MSRTLHSTLLHAALLAAIASSAHAAEFVYQGQLDDRGVPANGRYDLRIAAYTDEKSASGLMAPIEFSSVEVKDGRFELRFDAPLAKDREAWLEVAVRDVGAGNFATIPGRSKAISAPLIGACWSSTGDSGSDPATNFLGTTDAQPLVIKTGNVQSLRIEPSSILSGGLPITANAIAGSRVNGVTAGVRGATISGGGVPTGNSDPDFSAESPNQVADHYGTVGGGYGNVAGMDEGDLDLQSFAVVGGGKGNLAMGSQSTISGGWENQASGEFSYVGGGYQNIASGHTSTIGGGDNNSASADSGAVIGGGGENAASGSYSTVAGGGANMASGEFSAIGGGGYNTASGAYSTITGGAFNCAGGNLSSANGYRAKVRPGSESGSAGQGCIGVATVGTYGDRGAFVWADGQEASFVSTGPDQFLIRALNGVAINTNTPEANTALTVAGDAAVQAPAALSFGSLARQMINLYGTSYAIGVQSSTQYYRAGGSGYFAWFRGGVHSDTALDPGAGGTLLMTLGPGASTPTGTARAQSFTNVSDRAAKTGFAPIDAGEVLARVAQLPVSAWSYRDAPEVRHIGPVAQDFRAAFGLGDDERTISTVDTAGVALAAIQGLNAKLEAENAALREDNAAIRSELDALRELVESRLNAEH
ncbi:MAG: tail fiber domain-containing protein [Xanthomonadales bacterium]|nr:tail fiber domain-containing protein [Xanthomonadales bacterium]